MKRIMGRPALGLATLALLLFPAAATARTVTFKGHGTEDEQMKVTFDLHVKHGDAKSVEDADIHDWQACPGGITDSCQCPAHREDTFIDEFGRVDNDGDFKLEFEDDFRHYIFKGSISENEEHANGFFKGSHYTETTTNGCHTRGRIDWKAHAVD